jgi:hypothetical protein
MDLLSTAMTDAFWMAASFGGQWDTPQSRPEIPIINGISHNWLFLWDEKHSINGVLYGFVSSYNW